MKPETKIKHLVSAIKPLAECLKGYRPCARRIHIYRDDWEALRDNHEIAVINGFLFEEDNPENITYQGFLLVPRARTKPHGAPIV